MNSYLKTRTQDGICWITFNRPEALNALNPAAIEEIHALADQLKREKGVRAAVFCGAEDGLGKAFIAGADIKQMSTFGPEEALHFASRGQETFSKIESLPFLTIAAVNGFALGGGCEFALSCDLIFASDRAKFGQPEVTLGVIPGWGGTVRLTQRVGLGAARDLILSGRIISAQDAHRIGLADHVVSGDSLLSHVQEYLGQLNKVSPEAIRQAKDCISYTLDHPSDEGMQNEARGFVACFKHSDQKEGMSAFIEKREPKWSLK